MTTLPAPTVDPLPTLIPGLYFNIKLEIERKKKSNVLEMIDLQDGNIASNPTIFLNDDWFSILGAFHTRSNSWIDRIAPGIDVYVGSNNGTSLNRNLKRKSA